MYEAVLFDLFETLITESDTRPSGASSLGPRLGLRDTDFRKEWKRLRPEIVLGQISFVDALVEIGIALGARLSPIELEELRRERQLMKARALARIDKGVSTVIDQLLQRRARIGVISNCFDEDVAAWRDSTLAPRVHAPIFSFDVGLAKPDPAIYRKAIRRLNVAPEAVMYVGNGADNELEGARQAGLRAFRATWFVDRLNFDPTVLEREESLRRPEEILLLVA